MRVLDKISGIVNFLVENVVAILMGLMTVVVFLQVLFRITSGSLPWSEELARYMMIFMVYMGASVGVKNNNHIAVEFVVGLLPKRGKAAAEVIADLLMLICFVIIIYFGLKVVKVTMMQKSPVLRVKMGYVYMSLVAGGILMCLQTLVNLVHSAAALITGKYDLDVADEPAIISSGLESTELKTKGTACSGSGAGNASEDKKGGKE